MLAFIMALYFGFGQPAVTGPYYMQDVQQHIITDKSVNTKLTPELSVTVSFNEEQMGALRSTIKTANADLTNTQEQSDMANKQTGIQEQHEPLSIYFDFDSAILKQVEQIKLDKVIGIAKTVRLEGHASPEGTEEYNLHLSERRLRSVENFLISKGIEIKSAIPKGESECLNQREEWHKCRRVDIYY